MMPLSSIYRLSSLLLSLFITVSSAFQPQRKDYYCTSQNQYYNCHKAMGISSMPLVLLQGGVTRSNRRLAEKTGAISATISEDEQKLVKMREEIEQLRTEAIKRVEALSREADKVEEVLIHDASNSQTRENTVQQQKTSTGDSVEVHSKGKKVDDKKTRKALVEDMWEQNPPHTSSTSSGTMRDNKIKDLELGKPMPMQVEKKHDLNLLDHTHWRVMLDIGRDPGTWMPKTWGASGNRMLLNLELCFEADQLYDREEFLEGVGNAKVCRVVHHELNIAPTMTEGIKRVLTLKDGGWRIVKGAGPLGTDVLRFFIETETEIRQGDVYVPPGRIYCTCGYFVMHRPSGIKDYLRKEISEVEERIEKIREELQEEAFFSLKRLKLSKELFDLELKEAANQKALNEAAIVEPDKSLLRVSRKGDVGLTREGGVSCKVKKGPVTEYHVLGRFSVAAIEPRGEE